MARQVALLREINLGARRRVSMAELRELLVALGYDDVLNTEPEAPGTWGSA